MPEFKIPAEKILEILTSLVSTAEVKDVRLDDNSQIEYMLRTTIGEIMIIVDAGDMMKLLGVN